MGVQSRCWLLYLCWLPLDAPSHFIHAKKPVNKWWLSVPREVANLAGTPNDSRQPAKPGRLARTGAED